MTTKHIEDGFLLVEAPEEKTHVETHSSDDALSGWSELSAPSITSLSTVSIERLSNNNTPSKPASSKNFEVVSNATGVLSMATTIPSRPDSTTVTSTGELVSSKDVAPTNHEVSSTTSVGSRVPFSWAEITKIQPTFQKPSNPAGLGTGAPPPAESKVKPLRPKKKKLDDIPELDLYTTKDEVGRDARRAGKKGSRVKYPNGKRGSRRNARRKK